MAISAPSLLTIQGKTYSLPLYSPDATWAVARNLSGQDLQDIGLHSVMVNSYHLFQHPGAEILAAAGGVKPFMNWPGLVSSDSGGFQVFSLIQKDPNLGKITDEGIVLYSGSKKRSKTLFTPEESIRQQFAIGSDIMIALDDFTPPNADERRIEQSVKRTLSWAARAKSEFEKQLAAHHCSPFTDPNHRPWLLAPIQGHTHPTWRKYCADGLLEMGFDIFGLGGWPFTTDGQFDYHFCQLNASLTPDAFPRFALGVGTPENMVQLFFMGYQIFDCVLPTRDARHQRLYIWKEDPQQLDRAHLQALATQHRLNEVFDFLYIGRGSFEKDFTAIDAHCDCPLCQIQTNQQPAVSRAYLHHLFQIQDGAAFRLASLHNLRHFAMVMEILRK